MNAMPKIEAQTAAAVPYYRATGNEISLFAPLDS